MTIILDTDSEAILVSQELHEQGYDASIVHTAQGAGVITNADYDTVTISMRNLECLPHKPRYIPRMALYS